MKFNVTEVEFDFDLDYAKLTFDEEIAVRDLALGVWDADDEDDLIEEVTTASGFCIKSIDYEIQLKGDVGRTFTYSIQRTVFLLETYQHSTHLLIHHTYQLSLTEDLPLYGVHIPKMVRHLLVQSQSSIKRRSRSITQ